MQSVYLLVLAAPAYAMITWITQDTNTRCPHPSSSPLIVFHYTTKLPANAAGFFKQGDNDTTSSNSRNKY